MGVKFKAILPNKFNANAFGAELAKGLEEVAKGIQKDFDSSVQTWSSRPKFKKIIKPTSFSINTKKVSVFVGTDDVVYAYVSKGTSQHVISASGKALVYAIDSVPKTRPGILPASGGSPGGTYTSRKWVVHPGIAARTFDKMIAVKWKPQFNKIMSKAMNNAVKASGHGIGGFVGRLLGRLFG